MPTPTTSKKIGPQALREYNKRPAAEWGTFYEGCILWVRDKGSVDRHIPSLSSGLQIGDWVYDHPCVVLSLQNHGTKGQMVRVAPITSRPHNTGIASFIPIAPASAINGQQLSLRQDRKLDKQSYVRKVCFEIDYRMLALFNGARPDTFRLTKQSMKTLLAHMPKEIEWKATRPISSPSTAETLVPVGGLGEYAKPMSDSNTDDLEAQPLLLGAELHASSHCGSDIGSRKQSRSLVDSLLKLVLCVPVLLVLGVSLTAKFVWSLLSEGPVSAYEGLTKLLLAVCKGKFVDIVAKA